jgi:hopene-associated glycosyltransferase HpnB
MIAIGLAVLSALIWAYLMLLHGRFWIDDRDPPSPAPAHWPEVVAVIPARDEAPSIGETIRSLLSQSYPASLSIILVDDHSSDGTARYAREMAVRLDMADRLTVLEAQPLPKGWTGKLWAVSQGLERIRFVAPDAEYVLLTDADISHAPNNVAALVAKAEHEKRDLVSLMVELNCTTLAERAMIPAFVYFFRMLYPFAWVAERGKSVAAAAGGCMLARRSALDRIGGVMSFRDSLIDDCSLAQAMKPNGSIWLGLADGTRSLRVYPHLSDIRRMISRCAYTQLNYSPVLLVLTVLGLGLTFLAAPLLALFGHGFAALIGLVVWIAMGFSYMPILKRYRRPALWAIGLPAVASVYLWATVESAWAHWQGAGGEWKGRMQARKQ